MITSCSPCRAHLIEPQCAWEGWFIFFISVSSVMLPFSFILVAHGTHSGNHCFSNELFCHGQVSFSLDWRLVVGVKYTRPFSSLVRPVMSKYEMSQMQNYIIILVLCKSEPFLSCSRFPCCNGSAWMSSEPCNVQMECKSR
jgi:hypothetical protein